MSTILIADDEGLARELIEVALNHAGHQTITAANGADAMARLIERKPDVLLLDVAMPHMDGLATLRALRQNPAISGVPVIMLTSSADRGVVTAAARLGVRAYLIKSSFTLPELLMRINQALVPPGHPPSSSSGSGAGHDHSMDRTDTHGSTGQCRPKMNSRGMAVAFAPSKATGSSDAEDALRMLQPLMSRRAVLESIDKGAELRGFAPVVSEVLTMTSRADCAIEHLSEAIGQDPAMTLRILRLANSALYARGDPVDSLQKAILRIGLGKIRQTVMSIGMIERFSSTGVTDLLSPIQLWEHSIATATFAVEVARSRNDPAPDTFFTVGLLHDLGRLALIECLGDVYAQVLETARRLQLPLERVERQMLCVTHAEVMETFFRRWSFLNQIMKPVTLHHSPLSEMSGMTQAERTHVTTLILTDRLAHACMLGSSGNDTISPTEDLFHALGIERDNAMHIRQAACDNAHKMKLALLSQTTADPLPTMREVYRKQLIKPFRPLFMSDEPEFDACQVFCDQLKDQDSRCSNIVVMHINSDNDHATLNHQIRQWEQVHGRARLPMILISPSRGVSPDPSICADREVVQIQTPFVIDRFIAVANSLLAA